MVGRDITGIMVEGLSLGNYHLFRGHVEAE